MVGLEASIISHPRTWKASGHISGFKDIFVKCKKCKSEMKRIPDVIDVWIDSGTTSWNCLYYPSNNKFIKEGASLEVEVDEKLYEVWVEYSFVWEDGIEVVLIDFNYRYESVDEILGKI